MYFVVYFVNAKKYLVIPKHWVFDHGIALEKFINYSLNSNQSHMCYFANDVDQDSLLWHAPNFEAPFVNEFPFHGKEGRFIGLMKRFFNDFDDATKFASKLRHQKPAIYNEDRLHELPIPFVGDVGNDDVGNLDSFDSETNEHDHSNESFDTEATMASNGTTNEPAIDPAIGQSNELSDTQASTVFITTINEPVIDPAIDDSIESSGAREAMVSIGITDELAIDPLGNSIKIEEAYIEMNESDRNELYAFLHLDAEQIDETEINDDLDAHGEQVNVSFTLNAVSNVVASDGHAIDADKVNQVSCSSSTTDTNSAKNSVESNLLKVNESLTFEHPANISNNNDDIDDGHGGESSGADANLADVLSNINDIGGEIGGGSNGANSQNRNNNSIDEVEFGEIDALKGFPLPQGNITNSGLTKRENDVLSGNLPYSTKKNGSRLYEVGSIDRRLKIKKQIVNQFLGWNTVPFLSNPFYDRKIVHALLLMIVGSADVKNKIDCHVENFVRAFFLARVRGNPCRLDKFRAYVDEYVKQHE